jgi:hypothetical protein
VTLLPLLAVRSADLVWLAYIVGFIQSTVTQVSRPAENALLPRLVGDDHLLAANALNNNIARLIGPALGGTVMATTGVSGVVLIDVASFVAAAGMIALIATSGAVEQPEPNGDATAERAWRRVWREWVDGMALLRRNRTVAALLSLIAVSALGEGVMGVMFVVWVHDVLDGGSRELGWLMSAQAVGGLAGAALLGAVVRRYAPVRIFGIGSVVFGVLDLALFNYPTFISGVWLGLVLIALVGVPTIGMSAAFMTMLQQSVHDTYRGRVFGLMGTLYAALGLAGTLLAGTLGGVAGPTLLLTIQGGSYIAMGLLALAVLPALLAEDSAGQHATRPAEPP